MNKQQTVKLTQTALFSAIIIVMTFIPYFGYIIVGPSLSITTLHIPVLIGAIILGPKEGTILGSVWGVTCLIYAMMNGTADAAIFLNPLISVLPRIIVGFAAGYYYQFFRKITKSSVIGATITSALGTLTNTVLVLTAINLFGGATVPLVGVLKTIILTAIGLNGIIELIAALLIVTTASMALIKFNKRYQIN